jgi:RNA recognition motif-containing protein
MSEQDRRSKHPSELLLENSLNRAEYHVQKNEMMLFNLSKDTTEQSIRDHIKSAGINFNVFKITITRSANRDKVAHAKVEMSSPIEVAKLARKLRTTWIQDKKLKVKVFDDIKQEVFANRTVLVEGLPSTYKESNLSELFNTFGAVSGIELPLFDQFAEEAMLTQGKDPFANQAKEKERLDLLRS